MIELITFKIIFGYFKGVFGYQNMEGQKQIHNPFPLPSVCYKDLSIVSVINHKQFPLFCFSSCITGNKYPMLLFVFLPSVMMCKLKIDLFIFFSKLDLKFMVIHSLSSPLILRTRSSRSLPFTYILISSFSS